MSRILHSLLVLLVLALSATATVATRLRPAPVFAPSDNVIVAMNKMMFANIPTALPNTPLTVLNAKTFIAIHDAINSIEARYQPIYGTVKVVGRQKDANIEAAALSAFESIRVAGIRDMRNQYNASVKLYTAAQAQPYIDQVTAFVANRMATIVDADRNIDNGKEIGKAAANQVIAVRSTDGSHLNAPIQDFDCDVLGQWCSWTQKNLPENARGAGYPNHGGVQPFSTQSTTAFPVPPPLHPYSVLFQHSMNITQRVGGAQSVANGATSPVSLYESLTWASAPAGEIVARLTVDAITKFDLHLSIFESVAIFGRLQVANADSLINNLYYKYLYNSWRPQQAIRMLLDPTWSSAYVNTINQEYPCGHCEVTAAAISAVGKSLGMDEFPVPIELSGMNTPQRAIPVFHSVSEVMQHVNAARVVVGVHFPYSANIGSQYGARIGEHVAKTMFLEL